MLQQLFDRLFIELKRATTDSKDDFKRKATVKDYINSVLEFLISGSGAKDNFDELVRELGILNIGDLKVRDTIQNILNPIKTSLGEDCYGTISVSHKKQFLDWWEDSNLRTFDLDHPLLKGSSITADTPIYFSKEELNKRHIPEAMRAESGSGDIAKYCATLILRIRTLFADPRYEFLFGDYESFQNSLALFLRFCFGQMDIKYDENLECAPFISYYKNETQTKSDSSGKKHPIIIFDLSLLPSDVLDNITALLGRLILEFLQRYGKNNKEKRGNFPVVLVLEEAHNYIPERRFNEEDTLIARKVFERIAKEGRKFGLSLIVSSQRPSELSRTVMSQCNSFIVHRIQNPDDQEYVKKLVPSINQNLLSQLPILPQRHALIFGDCVRSPMEIKINEIEDKPDSHDPLFYKHWIDDNPDLPNFEEICKEWEGREEADREEAKDSQEADSGDMKAKPISKPSIPTPAPEEAQEAPSSK